MLNTDGWQHAVTTGIGSRDVVADGRIKNTGTVDTKYQVLLAIRRHSITNKLLQTYSDAEELTLAPGVTSVTITLEIKGIVTVAGEYLLMSIHLNSLLPTEAQLEVTPDWKFTEPTAPLVDGELTGDWAPAVS